MSSIRFYYVIFGIAALLFPLLNTAPQDEPPAADEAPAGDGAPPADGADGTSPAEGGAEGAGGGAGGDAAANGTAAGNGTSDKKEEVESHLTFDPAETTPQNIFTDRYGRPVKEENIYTFTLPNGGILKVYSERWKTFYTVPPTQPGCLCLTRGPLSLFKLIGNLHFPKIKTPTTTTRNADSTTTGTTTPCPPCPACDKCS